jgi:UDP-N-acetylglucosamine acyltransferase
MSGIHPSSQVSPKARIGQDVEIGPFCSIDANTSIGDGCRLEGYVAVKDGTTVGRDNFIAEGAVLGGLPQHKTKSGSAGRLVIGDGNTIREYVTIHRGLSQEEQTLVGDDNLIMVNAHVAHDCVIGNGTILANNVMLAGHVSVQDNAYLSGAVGVHQFCRIGCFAMVGGQAHVTKDVPPFITVDGASTLIVGLNIIGMRRAGFERAEIDQLKSAYRLAFRSGMRWDETIAKLRATFPSGKAAILTEFMSQTKRGCIQERRVPKHATIKLHVPPAETVQASEDTEQSKRASA